jgi:hypothetical protein
MLQELGVDRTSLRLDEHRLDAHQDGTDRITQLVRNDREKALVTLDVFVSYAKGFAELLDFVRGQN